MPRAITLRSDFAASDLRSLGLEGRAMVSAGSSCHGISCSRHHAAVRQKIHLSQLFRLPEQALVQLEQEGEPKRRNSLVVSA